MRINTQLAKKGVKTFLNALFFWLKPVSRTENYSSYSKEYSLSRQSWVLEILRLLSEKLQNSPYWTFWLIWEICGKISKTRLIFWPSKVWNGYSQAWALEF